MSVIEKKFMIFQKEFNAVNSGKLNDNVIDAYMHCMAQEANEIKVWFFNQWLSYMSYIEDEFSFLSNPGFSDTFFPILEKSSHGFCKSIHHKNDCKTTEQHFSKNEGKTLLGEIIYTENS